MAAELPEQPLMRPSRAVAAVALVLVALTVRPSAQTVSAGPFVTGEILVKFKPGANANARGDAHRAAGATPQAEIARTHVQQVRVRPGEELAAIARYRRNPNVLSAEPNFVRHIPTVAAHAGGSEVVPVDHYFGEQWGLNNTGQSFYCIPWISGELCLYGGAQDADIDAPEAWAISTGNSAVTVAVIDSGVDYTHPDLIANYAGGDDFVFGDGDPMDDHGHGTHVAGIIAAAIDNLTGTPAEAEGVVGVAPHARIRAYKVCRSDGTCDDFAIEQAIARAITDGANVINMSLGDTAYSQSLDDAVQDAWTAGLVIVAGAGNDGTTTPFYPAALNNVISVAAFDEDHNRPSFSNYGNWVDISAPGNAIMSTYPLAACTGATPPGDTGCYTWLTGTSMATPFVSGAAALVWSRGDVTSNSQVVDILLNSADGKGVSTTRLDSWTIHGGLNLHDAFSYGLTNLPPSADAGADQTVTDTNRDGTELVSLDGSASSDRDGTVVTYAWSEGGSSIATGETASVWLSVGVHTLTLEVTDDDGDSGTDTMVVTVSPSAQVTVTASTSQATEAGPVNGIFTVSRTGDTSAPLTVHYIVGGTAIAGTDYVALSGAATIDVGASATTIAVTPVDDTAFESNETVVITMTADAAYALGAPSAATVTIVSDDLPPDLIVTSVVAPSAGGADADIVVTDTTKNQGAGPSLTSKTGFYLSANTVLDGSDVFLGSRPVPVIGSAVVDTLPTTLHLPPATVAGSYYIFAKADYDGAVEEGVETNNTRASGVIKIGPDLVVSAVAAPATAGAGGSVIVTDTTKNQGAGNAAVSTTRFYLSANTVLDASDVTLGSRPAPALAGGASDASSTTLTLPAGTVAGTYYVIAQADIASAVPETSETNNTKTSSTMKVGPDLLVTAISAPASGAPGSTIAVTSTSKNQGAGSATASSTGFYLSANTSIDSTDVFLGSAAVAGLGPGATADSPATLPIPAGTAPGSYYVIGVADWNNAIAETAETNNDRASGLMKIGGDLVLTAVSASSTAKAGGPITIADTTKNQGIVPVSESATGFYLSLNLTYDPTDVFLGSRAVGILGPAETSTASTQLLMPAGTTPGSYYVIGVADWNDAVAESSESNNTRSTNTVRVGPDLVVTALSAPSSVVAGGSISATVTTTNQGGDTAAASVTRFYLSSDSSLDAGDVPLAVRAVPSLGAGLSDAGSVALLIPASTVPGTRYIIAKGDGDDALAEALENNNTRTRSISVTTGP
jgi:subtilisin family serine protease/subtilase family serine protease